MKKRYLSAGIAAVLLCSVTMSSCIGSFRLTNSVLKWNNQVGSKFLNEVVFFAFWILPVYEVTSVADLIVLNSIEFWSGRNPLRADSRTVSSSEADYLIASDKTGYTITNKTTGESVRLEHIDATDSWAVEVDGQLHPFMTFVDASHVKAITPEGDFRTVELSEEGLMAYKAMAIETSPEMMMALR